MTNHMTPSPIAGAGLDITNRRDLVGMCYTVWFNAILGDGDAPESHWHNVSEVQAGRQTFGPKNAFHYWGKPALGYYRSTDAAVIRTHMTQLCAAGVDFIIIDHTYMGDGWLGGRGYVQYAQKPMTVLLDTMVEMRAEGKKTPYVVFWIGTNKGPLYHAVYRDFYNVDKWKDCFVYWNGKPFIITWGDADACPCLDLFTVRTMRGLGSVDESKNDWSFLTIDNWGKHAVGADGTPEQVTAAVATQETYMSLPTAHGRDGGLFWFSQWSYAFKVHPKIVTLTWWNEWCAQRLEVAPGVYEFTDNYDAEHSRDIEPMEGGHGDLYYRRLVDYIAAYKNHRACPRLYDESVTERAEAWISAHR